MTCTACGKEVNEEKSFCGHCGMSIEIPSSQRAEDKTEQSQKKRKRKGKGKHVLIITLVYFILIIALFSYFYVSLRGWGAVPLINKLNF